MNNTLSVGNLPLSATADDLLQLFSRFGTVLRVVLIRDRQTGASSGFGYVEMQDGGDRAMAALDGTDFLDRSLVVRESERPFTEAVERDSFDDGSE